MTENALDLVLFLFLHVWVGIVSRVNLIVVELAKVLDVVNVVGDLTTTAGNSHFVTG